MELFFALTSLTPDGSLAFTLTVVIAGLGIVLGTLALLILIFATFGNAVSRAEKRAKDKQLKKAEVPKPPEIKKVNNIPPPPIIESGISPEIVAAISAAVYMQEGAGAEIKSIKRKSARRSGANVWAQAAVTENTKPF